jgi:hypothetical protein
MRNCYGITAVCTALILIGCNSSEPVKSYVPADMPGAKNRMFHKASRLAQSLPACTSKVYKAPGKFTVFGALGSFNSRSFAASGASIWANVIVPKGIHDLPVNAPKLGVRYTIYFGKYRLSSGLVGCFYLAKASLYGVSFNGAAVGWPNVHSYGMATFSAEGPLEISLKAISQSGGSGTLTLHDTSGKTVDTGSITIEGSKLIK